MDIFDKFLDATDSSRAPWYIIDGSSKKWAELQVLEILTEGIDVALQNHSLAVPIPQNVFPLMDMPKLSDISLQDKTVSDEEYSKRLKELQESFESCTTAFTTKRFLSSLHTKVGMLPEKAAISSV